MSIKNAAFGLIIGLGLLLGGTFPVNVQAESSDSYSRLIREAALVLLKEGNERFASGKPNRPNYDAARLKNTATEGQEPFATVIACSDSRVPVEAILDRGVGDLFVVRVAGNVAGPSELASIEYGVNHLNTPLLIVMGHSQCGAVGAVVKGTQLHGHLEQLAERIKPSAARVVGIADPDLAVDRAVEGNVWQTVADILKNSSGVREQVAGGKTRVLGAVYHLESGKVKWMGNHPEEAEFLQAETVHKNAESHYHPVTKTGPAHAGSHSPTPHGNSPPADPKFKAPPTRQGLLDPLSSPYLNPLEPAGAAPTNGKPTGRPVAPPTPHHPPATPKGSGHGKGH